jgi:hypothetical protein
MVQGFGGVELLRKLEAESETAPVAVRDGGPFFDKAYLRRERIRAENDLLKAYQRTRLEISDLFKRAEKFTTVSPEIYVLLANPNPSPENIMVIANHILETIQPFSFQMDGL